MKNNRPQVSTYEFIREDVGQELKKHPLLSEDNVLVDVEGEEIILYGDVDSEDKKEMVTDLVTGVAGVLHVTNNLKVIDIHNN